LEDVLHKSDIQGKFAEAQMAKQRIEYLRKLEKEKILQQKKNTQEEEVKI
jgi:hypothetical protein